MMRFSKKTVVITGAASGIGRAIALRLAKEGANIAALDVTRDGLSQLASEIAKFECGCELTCGSVEDLHNIDAVIASASDAFGGVDYLVNNAGVSGPIQRFDKTAPEDFSKMININLRPVWYGMQKVFTHMRERGGGAIVNVASMAGIRPNRSHALYGMTKAAVISLTHHAAIDYSPYGIRVNSLCPGPVDTPIFKQMERELGTQSFQAAQSRLLNRTLLNRLGATEEQADAVAFLLSQEAAFITGIAMPVDGGWSISDGQGNAKRR